MFAPLFLIVALSHAPLKDLVVKDQPTHSLQLKVGQKLTFSVFGNATTGANWTVKDSGKPGLKYLGMTSVSEKQSNPPRVGQGATYLISFKAVKKGTFKLNLIYGRSWELAKGAKPWGSRVATVVVR